MQKPASLRAALTAAIPEIRDQPDRLVIWVEDGAVRARQTETQGFAFQYPLSVLLRELSTDIAIVALAINRWLRRHQPDLLAGGAGDSYKFETDVLDNMTADILFTIDLCENVAVEPQPDGSWSIDYLVEPDPLFDDGQTLLPDSEAPPLQAVETIVGD